MYNWLLRYTYGFFNPVRIDGMRIHDTWYEDIVNIPKISYFCCGKWMRLYSCSWSSRSRSLTLNALILSYISVMSLFFCVTALPSDYSNVQSHPQEMPVRSSILYQSVLQNFCMKYFISFNKSRNNFKAHLRLNTPSLLHPITFCLFPLPPKPSLQNRQSLF